MFTLQIIPTSLELSNADNRVGPSFKAIIPAVINVGGCGPAYGTISLFLPTAKFHFKASACRTWLFKLPITCNELSLTLNTCHKDAIVI